MKLLKFKTMKKLYLLGLSLAFLGSVDAQDCSNGRYETEMFTDVDKTLDVQYGQNINHDGTDQELFLDVYEPSADTDENRPLIILIHGGSFMSGSKDGDDVTALADMYAKKGYVTSSISYRLGIPIPPTESLASEAVMRATQDAKAAVRFFKKSVADDNNPYGIDTTNIYLVGSSAGGFVALHLAYLDDPSEIPSYIDMSDPSLDGGIEGASGNPGHTSDVKAIVSLAGAIGDTTWMDGNTTPVLSLHGDQDETVPFGSEMLSMLIFDIMEVDGSESVHAKAENEGIKNCFKAEYGAGHVPHTAGGAYLDTAEMYITPFLLSEVCGTEEYCICNTPADPVPCHSIDGTTGIQLEEMNDLLMMYPNPAQNELAISLEGLAMNTISIYDVNGKFVLDQQINGSHANLNVSKLKQGVYFVKVETTKGLLTKKLIIE